MDQSRLFLGRAGGSTWKCSSRAGLRAGFRQHGFLSYQTICSAVGKYGFEFPGGDIQPFQPRSIRTAGERYIGTRIRLRQLDGQQPETGSVRVEADVLKTK